MRLSRHFSPLIFICGDFACTGRFRWQFIVRNVGSFVWGPAFILSVFSFLVSFCGATADFLFFQLWFSASVSGLQFRTLLRRHQPCTMSVHPLCFFLGACHYMQLSLLFLSVRFRSLSLRCFEWFRLQFVYMDRGSSIFGICLLMQFSFSFAFWPAVSQWPSLVFLVRFFRA